MKPFETRTGILGGFPGWGTRGGRCPRSPVSFMRVGHRGLTPVGTGEPFHGPLESAFVDDAGFKSMADMKTPQGPC